MLQAINQTAYTKPLILRYFKRKQYRCKCFCKHKKSQSVCQESKWDYAAPCGLKTYLWVSLKDVTQDILLENQSIILFLILSSYCPNTYLYATIHGSSIQFKYSLNSLSFLLISTKIMITIKDKHTLAKPSAAWLQQFRNILKTKIGFEMYIYYINFWCHLRMVYFCSY